MTLIDIALAVVALCVVPVLVRLWRGPTAADRAAAMDYAFFVFIAAIALIALRLELRPLFDLVLAATVVGFLAVVAVAYLIERRS
ncbi:MAG TPA: monovalent cation/H+ antiporter complex subunit F [Jiangellaceae bacterium]|nr:monovalent cation/H+ antiporter complex subunit F [Jiangellaceae bacterium]